MTDTDWPDPTPEMLETPEFNAVWGVIKGWDIERTPDDGYCGATGNDVRAILDAIDLEDRIKAAREEEFQFFTTSLEDDVKRAGGDPAGMCGPALGHHLAEMVDSARATATHTESPPDEGSANTLGVEPSGSGGASDSLTAIQAVKRMFYDDSVVGDSPRLSREELLRAIYKVVAPFDSAEAAATTKYTQPPRTT